MTIDLLTPRQKQIVQDHLTRYGTISIMDLVRLDVLDSRTGGVHGTIGGDGVKKPRRQKRVKARTSLALQDKVDALWKKSSSTR